MLVSKNFEVRAVYLTGTMAGSAKGLEIIRKWREAGGNSVVFDIKDSDGSVSVPTGLPLAPEQKSYPIRNLPKFTAYPPLPGTARHCAHCSLPRRSLGDPASRAGGAIAAGAERGGRTGSWSGPIPPTQKFGNTTSVWQSLRPRTARTKFSSITCASRRRATRRTRSFCFEAEHPDWKRADAITNFLKTGASGTEALGRAVFAGCLRRDGLAAAYRSCAHRAGYSADGEVLRRDVSDDLSLAFLRHGWLQRLRATRRSTSSASRWSASRR